MQLSSGRSVFSCGCKLSIYPSAKKLVVNLVLGMNLRTSTPHKSASDKNVRNATWMDVPPCQSCQLPREASLLPTWKIDLGKKLEQTILEFFFLNGHNASATGEV